MFRAAGAVSGAVSAVASVEELAALHESRGSFGRASPNLEHVLRVRVAVPLPPGMLSCSS